MEIRRWGAWSALLVMPVVSWLVAQAGLDLARGLSDSWRVEDAVVVAAAFVAAGVAGYLGIVGLGIVATALVTGLRWPRSVARLAPPAWRAVAGIALGMSLTAGAGTAALAQADGDAHVGWIPAPEATTVAAVVVAEADPASVSPVLVATAPAQCVEAVREGPPLTTTSGTMAPTSPSAVAANSATYTVVRGDSLWEIAASLLGPTATDGDVAQAWPELYEANRGVVGSDPSLIFAGQVLQIPVGLR